MRSGDGERCINLHTRRNPRGTNVLVVSPIAGLIFDGFSPTSNWMDISLMHGNDRPAGGVKSNWVAKTKSTSITDLFIRMYHHRPTSMPTKHDRVGCNFNLLLLTIFVNLGLFRHFERVTNIRTWINHTNIGEYCKMQIL